MAEQVQAVRAGFWRRIIAFTVDIFIVMLLLQPVAIFAYSLTDGRIQLSSKIISGQYDCTTLTALPPTITVTAFEPNYIFSCRSTMLGRTVSHLMEIGRKTRSGDTTTDGSVTVALDESDRPIGIFHLDWLLLPLTLLFRWWLDRIAATPGRLLTRIHFEARDPRERPTPGLAKRYGLFALPFLPLLPPLIWPLDLLNLLGAMPFIYALAGLAIAIGTIFLVLGIVPIAKRRDAFYDRCAGTAVVLDNPPKALDV